MGSKLKVNIDKAELKRGARLVVKIGTSVITNKKNAICERMIDTFGNADLRKLTDSLSKDDIRRLQEEIQYE